MSFCLPKFAADSFKAKLKDGTIDPAKLAEMSSDERRAHFSDIVGEENAKQVNAMFESKLLLKSQQQGIITWAKTVAGLKPEVLRDVLTKVSKMTEVLQPEDQKKFFSDLAEQKLGTHVTVEEAGKIAQLAKEVEGAKTTMQGGGDRLAYGRAKVAFGNYVSELKNNSDSLTLKERLQPGNYKQNISDLAGVSKGLKASLDNSAIFRQGWKTLFTNPTIWAKNAVTSFSDLARSIGGKQIMDEVHADIISRPTYNLMQKAKLDVGSKLEEQYPTHVVEKIPGLGTLYKASEDAYTGFVQRMRADVFDKYFEVAKKSGIDITDTKQLQSIGKLVNSLTGRGHLGETGEKAAAVVNNVFFSPRFLKSNLDFLTAHQFQGDVTPFVRKQAALNLAKVVLGSAGVLAIANTVAPGSVETDPRSSDFGKIRIGDTRFDVTGGMGPILTLAARILTMSSKSSVSGNVSKLNSGKFGSQTGADVVVNFAEGKLSPIGSIFKDLLVGQDASGNPVTPLNEANNLLMPLPITNAIELKNNPKSANMLAAMIADALGISVNTYSAKVKTPMAQADADASKQRTDAEAALQPTYDKVKALVDAGKKDEAAAITGAMSADEYATYKKMKAADQTKATLAAEATLFPTYQKIQDLLKQDDKAGAAALTSKMSADDYRVYQLLKKKYASIQ